MLTIIDLKKKRRELRAAHAAELRKLDTQIAILGGTGKRYNTDRLYTKILGWEKQGHDRATIAHELNLMHVPQPSGKRWSARSLTNWMKIKEIR